MIVLVAIGIVVIATIIVPFVIKQTKIKEAMDPSERYQVEEQPYPMFVTNLTLGEGIYKYQYGIEGDLVIDLPVGDSTLVVINRYERCNFSVDFTNREGIPESHTWNHCPVVKGVSVLLQKIYVE